ncbi:MAG: hypothetical protein WBV37_02900, partial [Nocardioidaceae bacterium]
MNVTPHLGWPAPPPRTAPGLGWPAETPTRDVRQQEPALSPPPVDHSISFDGAGISTPSIAVVEPAGTSGDQADRFSGGEGTPTSVARHLATAPVESPAVEPAEPAPSAPDVGVAPGRDVSRGTVV